MTLSRNADMSRSAGGRRLGLVGCTGTGDVSVSDRELARDVVRDVVK
jgi:hypothetical protein